MPNHCHVCVRPSLGPMNNPDGKHEPSGEHAEAFAEAWVPPKGRMHPLAGLGVKSWKDAINLFCLDSDPDFRVIKAMLAEGSVGFQTPAPEVGPCVVSTRFGDTTAAPSRPAHLQPSQQEPNHGQALVGKRMDRVPRQEILQQPCPPCHPSSVTSTRRGAPRRTPPKQTQETGAGAPLSTPTSSLPKDHRRDNLPKVLDPPNHRAHTGVTPTSSFWFL